MEIEKWEPFAWEYIHAGREDIGYRIASGILQWAKKGELALDLSHWFQWTKGSFWNQAVGYSRADGIVRIAFDNGISGLPSPCKAFL